MNDPSDDEEENTRNSVQKLSKADTIKPNSKKIGRPKIYGPHKAT